MVGAGLVGPVASLYLARRGHAVVLFERGPDPRANVLEEGRSVHLVVSARGWRALAGVGVEGAVRDIAIPLRGRAIHSVGGALQFQPYGTEEGQVIYAVQRSALHRLLASAAASHPGIEARFDHRLVEVDPDTASLEFCGPGADERTRVTAEILIAADGSFSRVRASLLRHERFDYSQHYMPYGYKELRIPPARGGEFPLTSDAMHVWPRKRLLLSAFPNPDKSFTAMLVMPFDGETSFSRVATRDKVLDLFQREFCDALSLMPDLADDYLGRPPSSLVTIRCYPWTHGGRLALIGDAAHAMVPFFGQGMNAGLEDCVVLDACLERHGNSFPEALAEYEQSRKPDCDAVTEMSLRNFIELSERVGDPTFLLQKRIEQQIHRMYPDRFIPLYSMVAFGHKPYAEVERIALAQASVVRKIMAIEGIERLSSTPELDDLIHRAMHALEAAQPEASPRSP